MLLPYEETKGAGNSYKGQAIVIILKFPVLWMNCVKHFLKRLHVKKIKNKKSSTKSRSSSAPSLKFEAWGKKMFCNNYYRFAVINVYDNALHNTGPRILKTNVIALNVKWYTGLYFCVNRMERLLEPQSESCHASIMFSLWAMEILPCCRVQILRIRV